MGQIDMTDISLQTVAYVAQIIGAGTIVTAVVFGCFQIIEYRRRRQNIVAMELMRSFYNRDLAHAVTMIRRLPDSVSATKLREQGPEVEEAAILITTTFEAMGLVVFRRIAPFSLVEELAGGMIVVVWRKLSVWLDTVREEQAQPSWAEWFQWLAEQMAAINVDSDPAYLRHRDWKHE
jgi:hypothetical protein